MTPSTPTLAAPRQLSEAAERLAALAADIGHLELAKTIREDAKRRLDDGRVRVVVLGEIKHGKSSLINALLQDKLLPVGVTPTTGAIVAVRVDPEAEQGTFLVARDGSRTALEAERFTALARGKDLDEQGRTPELIVDPERLPPTLELIDTPGFNDIDRFRAALSRSELPRADVLVLVLDATQVLSRSELGLIRDALAAVGGLEGSGARCMLVINRIDLVPEDERERIVAHIRDGLVSVIPGELEPYLTDAKTALRDGFEASEAATNVARLREDLFALAGRGREILPARARASMLRHARLLGYNAAVQSRALRLAEAELRAERAALEASLAEQAQDIAELRTKIREANERIVAASNERLVAFRDELEQAALAQVHSADIHTLSQIMPGAIQDAFLEFVTHERERLRAELEQLTRDLIATCGELARRRLETATLPLGFRGPGLYVEPPKIFIEVGTLALGLVGTIIWYFGNTMTGMVMTIASPLTTVILREKTVRDARQQVRAVLPGVLDEAIAQLREIIGATVERHGEALDDHLMLADHMLREQLLEGLRRAGERLETHAARLPAPASNETVEAETEGPDDEAGEAESQSEPSEASEPEQVDADEQARAEPEPESSEQPTNDKQAESEAQARQRRICAAALSEFDALESKLSQLVREIETIELGSEPNEEQNSPPLLH